MPECLTKKIINIQNELRITKDGENTFSKYEYFKPDTILKLLNPLLQKHGVYTKFNLNYKQDYYQAELILADTESEQKEIYNFDILKATVKGANEAQNSGATLTYAKRYSLMNAFNIAENNSDFDSDEMTKKQKEAEKKEIKTGEEYKKAVDTILNDKPIINNRNFFEETKGFTTGDQIKEWWNSLGEEEKKKAWDARHKAEVRLTKANIEKIIDGLKTNTWEKNQTTVLDAIDESEPGRRDFLKGKLEARLKHLGIEFEYPELPF